LNGIKRTLRFQAGTSTGNDCAGRATVRAQLGLKLVSTEGPIRSLVIDHVEPLSGN